MAIKIYLLQSLTLITYLSYQAALFGDADSLPNFLARQHIPWLDIVVDPCAAVMVLIVTGLLCLGIKEVDFYYNLLSICF